MRRHSHIATGWLGIHSPHFISSFMFRVAALLFRVSCSRLIAVPRLIIAMPCLIAMPEDDALDEMAPSNK